MILHANAVAQDGAAGVRAGGIDGDDPNRAIIFPIMQRQLVDQRTLAGTGRTSQADDPCTPSVRKKGFQQLRPFRGAVLHRADGPGERARITCAQALYPLLHFVIQTVQCKAGRKG